VAQDKAFFVDHRSKRVMHARPTKKPAGIGGLFH
jgi:hypothetical protein